MPDTWTIGTITPGQQNVTATVTATIDATGTLVNTATISSPVVDDPDLDEQLLGGHGDLGAARTRHRGRQDRVGAAGRLAGRGADRRRHVEFTITAENIPGPDHGCRDGASCSATSCLTGLTFVSQHGDGDYDAATGRGRSRPSPPAPRRPARSSRPSMQPISFVNTVDPRVSDQNDTDPTNNSASVGVTGIVLADLAITKSVEPGRVPARRQRHLHGRRSPTTDRTMRREWSPSTP